MRLSVLAISAALALLAGIGLPMPSASRVAAADVGWSVVSTKAERIGGASGAATASLASCTLGTTEQEVYSSDYGDRDPSNPVYIFPKSTFRIYLVSTVYNWPGGNLIQDVILFSTTGRTLELNDIVYTETAA